MAADAEDPRSLIAALKGSAPTVVVLAPSPSSLIAAQIRAVRQRLRDVPIVALIPTTDESQCRRAISAGADGAVLERDVDEALVVTVRAVAVGQISFPEAIGRGVEDPALTRREKQVLGNVAMGFTNAQIADRLGLAESTIKSHLSSAFSKLGVASRAEAAALIRDPTRARRLDNLAIEAEASE